MSRVRTEKSDDIEGVAKRPSVGQYYYSTITGNQSQCVDEVIEGDGHDLTITRAVMGGDYKLNGSWYNGFYGWAYVENFGIQYFRDPSNTRFGPLDDSARPANSHSATRLLAMTNPSRPVVDLPVFIGEMGDLPRLVQLAGKGLLQKGASANLSAQFGWAPLIGDVQKLLDFTSLVAKREKELRALQANGLRRTRTLWTGSTVSPPTNVFTMSFPTWVQTYHYVSKKTNRTIRGHVRWYPTDNFPTTDAAMLRMARRAAAGITLDASTAWELIPFSWLADWYGNVGTFLKANRNVIPCTHDTPQIMEHTWTETLGLLNASASDRSDLGGTKITVTQEMKTRRRVSASLTASLPALSGKQLSILGSLAILKKR